MNMTCRVSRFDTENRTQVQSLISLKHKTRRHYSSCCLTRNMQTCRFVCVLATSDIWAALTLS